MTDERSDPQFDDITADDVRAVARKRFPVGSDSYRVLMEAAKQLERPRILTKTNTVVKRERVVKAVMPTMNYERLARRINILGNIREELVSGRVVKQAVIDELKGKQIWP